MISAIINGQVFDGRELHQNLAVILNKFGFIADLIPQTDLSDSMVINKDLERNFLVPGFIDLQVNGGGGRMFNNDPSVDTIRTIGRAHRKFGTTGFMPTLTSANHDKMQKAIRAVKQAMRENVPGVLGIHLDESFLNPTKKKVGSESQLRAVDDIDADVIMSLGVGNTIVTLAPEFTSAHVIKKLAKAGVIVCAGQTNANYTEVNDALNAGVSGFTHLYNATSPLRGKVPGATGLALADEDSWFGVVADGHHVHPASFKVAVSAKRRGGVVLVTDAMAGVGADEEKFELAGDKFAEIESSSEYVRSGLAGSHLDMNSAVKNTIEYTGMDMLEAVRMATLYPAKALGVDHEYGRIAAGYWANFVSLNTKYEVTNTWINGEINI